MSPELKFYLLNWFEFEIIKPTMIDSMDDEDDDKLDLLMSDVDSLDDLFQTLSREDLEALHQITQFVSKSGSNLEYIKSLKSELETFF